MEKIREITPPLTEEELDDLFGPLEEPEQEPTPKIEKIKDLPETLIKFKCKPTWNYQSIEFEVEGHQCDITSIVKLYSDVLEELIKVSPAQDPVRVPKKPAEPLASEKQIACMEHFKIKYPKNVTQKEAQKLIEESINNAK